MKTTVLIDDELYEMLSEEARNTYGSMRKMSSMLNEILSRHFARKKDMFGSTPRFDVSDLRDKKDRV